MLSYMIPMDEKPPAGPAKAHLQLTLSEPLTNGRQSVISKENSVSSFASDATTATVSQSSATPTSITENSRCKPKLLVNGGKHQNLKRVSFGSSKGSMVETLIYETPVQEEPETSPIAENVTPFPEDHDQTEDEREKVRVSFVQQSKPQEVVLPDEPAILSDNDYIMAATIINDSNHIVTTYIRQESTESGWDNPFRPGGDLSREADEIVELIKGGKPITPTASAGNASPIPEAVDHIDANNTSTPIITESPKKKKQIAALETSATPKSSTKNGSTVQPTTTTKPPANNGKKPENAVDIKRGTIGQPADASQIEHVVIKKKAKCKCCVIQ